MRRAMLLVGLLVALVAARGCRERRDTGAAVGQLRFATSPDAAPRRLPTIAAIRFDAFPDPARHVAGGGGRTITVRPTGPGVVAAALEGARPGDTILLEPGTYREGKEGDYRALGIDEERIRVRTRNGRARIVPRGAGVNYGLEVHRSHTFVQGLDLQGFPQAAVALGREEETLRDVVLSDVTIKGPADGKWHEGISTMADRRQAGSPAVEGLLLRNVSVEQAALGISCGAGPCRSWWLENVRVRAAEGEGWGADGIAVEAGDNFVLHNVEVSGTTGDGIDLKAEHVLIMNAHVHHTRRNGIKLWRGGDVVNVLIHDTYSDAALVFDGEGRYRLLHSLVANICRSDVGCHHLAAGYDTKARQRVELVSSIFTRTHGGLFAAERTALEVRGCLFFDAKNGEVLEAAGRKVTLEEGPAAIEQAGLGRGNLFEDPRLVDAAGGDLRPRAGSPALDRGVTAEQAPLVDVTGAKRAQGAGPDLGPFESTPGQAPTGGGCSR